MLEASLAHQIKIVNTISKITCSWFYHPSYIKRLMISWLSFFQPRVYSIPGEVDEYSQVDKKSSQKRLISQTSSDKQKSWDHYNSIVQLFSWRKFSPVLPPVKIFSAIKIFFSNIHSGCGYSLCQVHIGKNFIPWIIISYPIQWKVILFILSHCVACDFW